MAITLNNSTAVSEAMRALSAMRLVQAASSATQAAAAVQKVETVPAAAISQGAKTTIDVKA